MKNERLALVMKICELQEDKLASSTALFTSALKPW